MKVKNMELGQVLGAIRSENSLNEQLLFRLVSDCKYYLGHGNRNKNVLWSKDEYEQIKEMETRYRSLVIKPRGITDEDIRLFRLAMFNPEKVTCLHAGAKVFVGDHLPAEFVGTDGETNIDEYLNDQWFIERWELEDEPIWLVWVGGKVVDYLVNEDFVNEILAMEAQDIAN